MKSFIKTTCNKKQYRRLLAILQKVKGRTYEDTVADYYAQNRMLMRDIILKEGASTYLKNIL
ncbi:MAG: hypothetical protein WAM14_19655 [Candidatus Nitrosopolaris sp.]